MQRVFLILILIITGIYTASCGELNTIHFPGDILTNTCKDQYPNFKLINNEQDLKTMEPDGQYCLTQNINIDTWDEKQQPFTGIFDGNNKTITIKEIIGNAFIQQIGDQTDEGKKATFKNVNINIKNINPDPTGGNVGALARINYGTIQGVTLNNVTVSGSGEVGGLVGKNEGEITNVTLNNVTVNGSGEVGGLVGTNDGNNARIEDVKLTNITVSGGGNNINIGGLVGVNFQGSIIKNAKVVSRSITAAGQGNVGGLVGKHDNGKIEGSHANTDISYPDGDGINVGGFIGLQGLGTITKCSSKGSLIRSTTSLIQGGKDPSNLGGFIGLSASGTIQESYTMTDITDFVEGKIKVGGFIGLQGGGEIKNAYSAGELVSKSYAAGGNTYVGGFIGQQTSGGIYYVYTRSTISTLGTTASNIFRGHLAGKVGTIAQAYYRNTNSKQITKAKGEKVGVDANGKPVSGTSWALNVPNDPNGPVWHIKDGEWPTLKNNPE